MASTGGLQAGARGVVSGAGRRGLRTALVAVEVAFDPLTFAGMSLAVLIGATIAALVPARRASRVDPIVALRQDS